MRCMIDQQKLSIAIRRFICIRFFKNSHRLCTPSFILDANEQNDRMENSWTNFFLSWAQTKVGTKLSRNLVNLSKWVKDVRRKGKRWRRVKKTVINVFKWASLLWTHLSHFYFYNISSANLLLNFLQLSPPW